MKRKIKGGDCYYIAGQFAMDNVFSPKKIDYKGTPYLVHAEVQGQGKVSNLRYGHAWIEDDENVYDFSNARELIIPKVLYYAIGDIRTNNPKKYQKYTFSEARKRMLQYKHYGCWDLDVEYKEGGNVISSPIRYEIGGIFQGTPQGGLDNIEVKIIEDDSLAEKVYNIIEDDLAVGVPRLALLENNKVIGGIYLEPANSYVLDGKRTVEPLWEYKFDIYIKRSKRKKGYSKLLLDAMIKDFIDNFPDADQIRGEVINNRLEKSLIKNYGFHCDSRNQEEITYCYLSRESAIKYLKRRKFSNGGTLKAEPKEKKDIICSSCGWSWNKHQSEEHDVYVCHKCGTDNSPAHNILKIEQLEIKLGRKLHWWNDDIVYLSGIEYKKVYLRPEYKKVI
jgi:hypothetical protein